MAETSIRALNLTCSGVPFESKGAAATAAGVAGSMSSLGPRMRSIWGCRARLARNANAFSSRCARKALRCDRNHRRCLPCATRSARPGVPLESRGTAATAARDVGCMSARRGASRRGASHALRSGGALFFSAQCALKKRAESSCKPGSVRRGFPRRGSHSSRRRVATALKQPTRRHRGPRHCLPIWSCSRWGLPCRSVAGLAVRSYRTISPLPSCLRSLGRFLSVALSVGSRRPGVTWHRARWSPDFPRHACA
jgi:hypothetical protein